MPNYSCLKKPIISEKSSIMQESGVYTFEVEMKSTKPQIKSNVESAYGVDVLTVRTIISKGPKKRKTKPDRSSHVRVKVTPPKTPVVTLKI